MKKNLQVCFSPLLFEAMELQEPFTAVVCDIFRATSSFCMAFQNGIESITPIADIEQAKKLKKKGFLVAGECNGEKPDFADFGNDPMEFTPEKIAGKSLYFFSTNGTKTILQVSKKAALTIVASFLNLNAVVEYLCENSQNVVICCSGWKGSFSFEDAFFSGALSEKLLESALFSTQCDSVYVALQLWKSGKNHPEAFIEKQSSHLQRLKKLGKDEVLHYAFKSDVTDIVPIMRSGIICKK